MAVTPVIINMTQGLRGIAMKLSFLKIAILGLLVLSLSSARAELVTETSVGSGYQGNLFNDSNSIGDAYASAGLLLKYYPSSAIQIAAGARYNGFARYDDLSNFTGDLSLTIIPTKATSPFSVSFSGSLSTRSFGLLYELYDQNGAAANMNLGYRLAPWLYWQSSVSYLNTSYQNSDYGSSRAVDVGSGFNVSFLGSNSIALKFDYSKRLLDQPILIEGDTSFIIADNQSESETFEVTGLTLRYSRPLGEKTGMNLSVGHRKLHVNQDYAVLGYTIDYLSPWSELWEGESFSSGLKHIFSNQIIGEFSFAYYDKNYVDVIELVETSDETYWREVRIDQLTTLSAAFSKSFSMPENKQLTPSMSISYRNNSSTSDYFDYNNLQLSFSLKMRM